MFFLRLVSDVLGDGAHTEAVPIAGRLSIASKDEGVHRGVLNATTVVRDRSAGAEGRPGSPGGRVECKSRIREPIRVSERPTIVKSLVALLVATVGCGGASTPDADAEAGLLGAAAAHRVLEDNSFGGDDVFDRVEVIEVLGRDNRSDLLIEFDDESPELTAAQRAAIVDSLSPTEVEFVSVGSELISDSATQVARLSLAVPEGSNGDASVATGLACGADCGAGGAQRFMADDDAGWRFVENVGDQWIS